MPFSGAQVTATVTARTNLGATDGTASTEVEWGRAPGAVADLNVTPNSATKPVSAVVDWTGPVDDGGIGVDNYQLCWAVNGVARECETTSRSPSDTRLDRVGVSGLQPNDVVTVTVKAHNGRGDGPETSASFTVLAEATTP